MVMRRRRVLRVLVKGSGIIRGGDERELSH